MKVKKKLKFENCDIELLHKHIYRLVSYKDIANWIKTERFIELDRIEPLKLSGMDIHLKAQEYTCK